MGLDCRPSRRRRIFVMDTFLRRKRLLKTIFSITLVFGTLLMIQKFRVADSNLKILNAELKNNWCGLECDLLKKFVGKSPDGNDSAPLHSNSSTRAPLVNSVRSWDVNIINCSEDVSVRNMDWFRRLDPRFHQFVLHRHCRYFPLLLNHPEKCSEDVDLLVVVKSVIEQHDRREAVRKTWGREQVMQGKKIKTLFLLGRATTGKDAKNLQKLIELEDKVYSDIIQWDFMDTFFNLTLKEVNFLRWFNIYCSNVPFIFKGDDDVFVNTKNLIELIGFKIEQDKVQNLFVGDTISRAFPIRNRQSKYYIPKELFDKPYPPYVGGGGFLVSSQLARRLLVVSEGLQLYPIDDVFLGMCLQKLRIAPEMHPGFKTFGIMRRRVSPMNSEPCFFRNLIVIHKLNPQELLRMWSIVQDENLTCSRKTLV